MQWDEKLMKDKDVNTANIALLSTMEEVDESMVARWKQDQRRLFRVTKLNYEKELMERK